MEVQPKLQPEFHSGSSFSKSSQLWSWVDDEESIWVVKVTKAKVKGAAKTGNYSLLSLTTVFATCNNLIVARQVWLVAGKTRYIPFNLFCENVQNKFRTLTLDAHAQAKSWQATFKRRPGELFYETQILLNWCRVIFLISYWKDKPHAKRINVWDFTLRCCLHAGGGPQIGEVTHLGGVTSLSV